MSSSYEIHHVGIEMSDFSLERSFFDGLIFDTDSIQKPPFRTLRINLDNIVDLSIEPLDMNRITRMSICNRHNAPFASICGEFSEMMSMMISELNEFFYDGFDCSTRVSLYLEYRVSLEISDISTRLQQTRINTEYPMLCLEHYPITPNISYILYRPSDNIFCKRLH